MFRGKNFRKYQDTAKLSVNYIICLRLTKVKYSGINYIRTNSFTKKEKKIYVNYIASRSKRLSVECRNSTPRYALSPNALLVERGNKNNEFPPVGNKTHNRRIYSQILCRCAKTAIIQVSKRFSQSETK